MERIDYDLQIVVNKRVWELANATQREALVAHELCHFEPKEDEDLEGESA